MSRSPIIGRVPPVEPGTVCIAIFDNEAHACMSALRNDNRRVDPGSVFHATCNVVAETHGCFLKGGYWKIISCEKLMFIEWAPFDERTPA